MRKPARARFLAYGVAVGGPLLVWLARFAATPWLGPRAQFIRHVVPIVLSAWFGGLRPGLASTALCGFFAFYPLVPQPSASIPLPGPMEPFAIVVLVLVLIAVTGWG